MKTKYLFSKSESLITHDTLFCFVMVGNSLQERRDANFIASLTMSPKFFWAKYTNEVSKFLDNVNNSLNDGTTSPVLVPQVILQVSELRRLLKSCQYDTFAKSFVNSLRSCRAHNFSNHDAYQMAKSRAANITCNAAHVINLKAKEDRL